MKLRFWERKQRSMDPPPREATKPQNPVATKPQNRKTPEPQIRKTPEPQSQYTGPPRVPLTKWDTLKRRGVLKESRKGRSKK